MLSIVTSMYRSELYVQKFYERVCASVEPLFQDFEIIFVDDGFPDNSKKIVHDLSKTDSRVKLLPLSRNFGHARAMLAGLEHAKGDYIFALDCDLEESPEWISSFFEVMKTTGSDCVIGKMIKRKGHVRSIGGVLFYKFFIFATGVTLVEDQTWARLLNRSFLNQILRYSETHLFFTGIFNDVGMKQVFVPIEKHYKGSTSYTFKKRVSIALDAITSFGAKPMERLFILGLMAATFFVLMGSFVFLRSALVGDYSAGWPSLILSIWLMGSLNIMFIAVIGIYVAKIFEETKKRPRYIIKDYKDE